MVGSLEHTGEIGARGVECSAYLAAVGAENAGEGEADAASRREIGTTAGLDVGDAGSLVAVPHL